MSRQRTTAARRSSRNTVTCCSGSPTAWSGGKAKAPRRIIETASKVAHFLEAIAGDAAGVRTELAEINGVTGVVGSEAGRPVVVLVLDVAGGQVQRLYLVNNPDKLGAVAAGRRLHR